MRDLLWLVITTLFIPPLSPNLGRRRHRIPRVKKSAGNRRELVHVSRIDLGIEVIQVAPYDASPPVKRDEFRWWKNNDRTGMSVRRQRGINLPKDSLPVRLVREIDEQASGVPRVVTNGPVELLRRIFCFSRLTVVHEEPPLIGFEAGARLRAPGEIFSIRRIERRAIGAGTR